MRTTKYAELKAELNNQNLSREERGRIRRYEAYKAANCAVTTGGIEKFSDKHCKTGTAS